MHRNLTPLLLAALLSSAACGGNWSDADLRFYASLPDRQTLESKLPQDQAEALGTGQQALVGEPAALFLDTRTQSRNFNHGLLGLLDELERATRRAPSSRAPNLRIWGPYLHWSSRQHQVRLVVRWVEPLLDDDPSNDDQEDHFEHALQLRRVGEDDLSWVPVIAGGFIPGTDPERLRSGTGVLILNVDGLRAKGLPTGDLEAFSRIDLAYDTTGWPVGVFVAVHFVDAADGELRYGYLEGEDGGGVLRFVLTKNHVPGPGLETLVVASAWSPEGPGRANVLVAGGDLAAPVTHEQCWDGAGLLVYERNWLGVEDGRRLDCPPIAPPEPVEPAQP